MRALVTGATGLIGRHLVAVLAANGVEICAYVRPSTNRRPLKSYPIKYVVGTASDEVAMLQAVAGVDFVFHVAGYLTANAPFGTDGNSGADEWPLYQAVNVDFTAKLLAASLDAQAGRFVYVSSSSVYSLDAPVPTPEDAPLAPLSLYGRSKLQAEAHVQQAQKQGLATTIIRPPVAYGPGDRYFTPMALRLARLPLLPLVNGGRTLMDMVYVQDVAELLWLCGQREAANGRIYNAGPGYHTSLFDLVAAYRELTGSGPRIVSVRSEMAGRTAWLSRRLVRPFVPEASAALTPAGLNLMNHDLHLDMTRAAADLNFTPRYSLLEGLRATINQEYLKGRF